MAFLILGICIYQDYGISWDERVERIDGAVSLKFIQKKFGVESADLSAMLDRQNYKASLELVDYKDRYYPTGFNLPVESAIQFFQIADEQQAYFFRHLLTFLIVLLGVFAIFLLANRRYKDWRLGLLVATFFILSPRFFAESFYNSKDLVLLAFFAIAMNTMISFVLNPRFSIALFHALATALAMNIRLMAIVIPVMTLTILLLRIIRAEIPVGKTLLITFIYILTLAVLMVLAWPLLWSDPLGQFIDALYFMRHYLFVQDNFYLGKVVSSINLPWHYLPVWIGITTPIPYLILWFVGASATLACLFQNRWRLWSDDNQLQDLIFLGLFLAPVLGVISLHSVIYDSWRHLYFIYPAFLLLVLRGWTCIWIPLNKHFFLQKIIVIILASSLISTARWMISAHPIQNVYFNAFAGMDWKSRFDVDYWGLSNRQALEYILQRDQRKKIHVKAGSFTFLPLSLSILNSTSRNRFTFTEDLNEADYIISNYRLNQTNYGNFDYRWIPFHDIRVGNEIVLSIAQAKRIALIDKVKVNQNLDFSKNGFGQYFLQENNWSRPESWGTWANGAEAKLTLPLPKDSVKNLVLDLRALISKQHPSQMVDLKVNGQVQKTLYFSSAEHNSLIVPITPKIQKDNFMEIEFIFKNPITPKSIGMGDDDRLLSIGLISAVFVP